MPGWASKREWFKSLLKKAIPNKLFTDFSHQDFAQNEAWSNAIIGSAYDAFIAINSDGKIIEWNQQAEKTFGWKKSEVLGLPLHQTIIPNRHREGHQRGLKHFLATGDGPVLNKRIEIDSTHRDGHEIPIELTIFPVRQGDKLVFGSFLHDISERKRAQRLQKTQMSVTNTLTESGTLNSAVAKILENICTNLGWSIGEFWMNDSDKDFLKCTFIWTDQQKDFSKFQNKTQSMSISKNEGIAGKVWTSEKAVWIEDFPAEKNFPRAQEAAESGLHTAVAFPVRVNEQMMGVMAFFVTREKKLDPQVLELMQDIGQRIGHFILRKQGEEKIAQMNLELEQRVEERTRDLESANEQLKSAARLKDEFLATVSHELRTPLSVIQGHSDIMLRTRSLSTQDRQSIEAINRNAKVQAHIINDLLDISSIISGKLQLEIAKIDLKEVIQAALDSIRIAAASKNIAVNTDTASVAGLISGDFNRLQQVLWNLLTNAVKFTPKGGAITIGLRNMESWVQVFVRDTGKGIETDFLPYVFDRFRQEDASTTRRFGGLGLGLSIARHIVEAHGGVIEVASLGKDLGAEFVVNLPILAVHWQVPATEEKHFYTETQNAAFKNLKGANILVIDDQEDAREMLQKLLESSGAHVITADSVQQAFAILPEKKWDLIVSDIGMPQQDGYEFILKLRNLSEQQGGKIPAIALTAYAHNKDQEKALSSGFQAHLSKPVEPEKLIETISQLIGN